MGDLQAGDVGAVARVGLAVATDGCCGHDDLDGTLEALAEFRRRKPRAAEQIAEALEAYEAAIRRRLDEAVGPQAS